MDNSFMDKQVLITGAAGFLGSHLTERLLKEGAWVTGVDNFITGKPENLAANLNHERFTLIEADASLEPMSYLKPEKRYHLIYHLASPASPPRYQHNPVATYMVNGLGTHRLLELAGLFNARFVFTSTSEAYGDPLEHPQKESYWGNVNTVGPRSCYDESKRFGEMVCHTFNQQYQADARIVRIFNTYGPRMDPLDGRVMPAFITQALDNRPITVEGDGQQTRSFCYVDDLIEYLVRVAMVDQARDEIINIGNPDEHAMLEIAQIVKEMTGSSSEIIYVPARPEDISRRQPDITKAKTILGYEPQVTLTEGLERTIKWFGQPENRPAQFS